MMAVFSKINQSANEKPYTCYEVAHVWNPNCKESSIDLFFETLFSSSKLYATFYLISMLFRWKDLIIPDTFLKYIRDVVTSSLFLSFNTSSYLSLVCLMRQFFGIFDRRALFLAASIASYIAINFEQKKRRQALALYVTNVASETLFWMLHSRNLINTVPYGDVLLMSVSCAVLNLLYRKNKLKGVIPAVLDVMLDKTHPKHLKSNTTSVHSINSRLLAKLYKLASYIHQLTKNYSHIKLLQEFMSKFVFQPKHKLCHHQNDCFYNAIKSSFKVFTVGYVGRFSLTFFINLLKKCFKKSHRLNAGLKHQTYLKFGNFLAGFVFLYYSCECMWRHVFGMDSSQQALVSGFLAGLAICFHRSPSISVYLFWKAIEMLWLQLIDIYPWLNIRQGIKILYSISTALLLYAGTLEAHNVRPAYIKFLNQISNDRFKMINRKLLDGISKTQQASKYFPFFPVVIEMEKTSANYRKMVEEMESSGKVKYFF